MEKIDFAFFGYIGIATLCAAITIVLMTNRGAWMPALGRIVSIVSGHWQSSVERAKAQKAQRDRLYGYATEPVLGYDRTGSNGGSAGSRDLVPGQQHQAEPQEPGEDEPGEKSFARQLAREELIITLAVQRKDNGDYLFSANEITKFVGGTAAPVKNTIANVRGRKEMPPAARSVQRPLNGW